MLLLPAVTSTLQQIFNQQFGSIPMTYEEAEEIYNNAYFDGGPTPEEVAQWKADYVLTNDHNDLPF
jgi:hypothetical protein